jgi:hypothetical protein
VSKSALSYQSSDILNNSGSYVDLGNNGSVINTANQDNANSVATDIGFTFYYNCSSFTQFVLNTNGFIKLGNTAPSSAALFFNTATTSDGGAFNSSSASDHNLIIPFNHDLINGTSTAEYRKYTSGTAPNRVCTIQFENVRDKTSTPLQQYNNMNFQIKLYETSNRIEFIYGNWQSSSNQSSFKTSALGLKGSGNGYGQLITGRKSSVLDWSSIIFENLNYNGTSTLNFGNPPDRPKPDLGRTISFMANTDLPLVSTNAATSVTSSTAILNGDITGMGIYTNAYFEYGTTTAYGNIVIGNPYNIYNSSSTTISEGLSGLLPNTTYHYRIKAVNLNGISYGNDMVFNTTTVGTGSAYEMDNSIGIFPNPSSGNFKIRINNVNTSDGFIRVLNFTGQEVEAFRISFSDKFAEINLISFPAGIYYIEVNTNEQRYYGKVLIN